MRRLAYLTTYSLTLWMTLLISPFLSAQVVPLNTYLDELSAQHEVNIIFDQAHVERHTITSPSSDVGLEDGLSSSLAKTDLTFKKIDDLTYVIKKQKPSSSPIETKSVAVRKKRIKINGVVKDSESRELLIGTNIIEVNTFNGTISDLDGAFQLEVTEGSRIEISYIGYQTIEYPSTDQGEMEILLTKNASILDEIVVVGYGSQKKSDLTGAISSIGIEELKQLPSTGLEQAIQGRASGVYITQNSGSPGGAMSVRIRGSGSTNSAEPLYVVDGIPFASDNQGTSATFEQDGGGQFSNALTTINPNDIESIEVLKDASATAIYGSRAANGVVIITTKKGVSGKSSMTYDTYAGIQQLYRKVPVMNLREYAEYIGEVSIGDIEEFKDLDLLGEGTNWQDVIFRDALMQNHQFSLSGGNEDTRFSAGVGFHKKDGIVQGSDFTRTSAKLNVDHNYSSKFRIGFNIIASRTKENITFNDNSNGVIYTALLTPPMVPARRLDGSFGEPPEGENVVLTFDNPLANATEVSDINRKNRLLGSIWAEIDLTSWLKYKAEVATDILFTNHNTFWPSFQRGTQSRKSKVRRNNNNNLFWITKHLLTYNNVIKEKHKLTVLGGFEAQEGSYEYLYATRENLPTNELSQLNLGDAGTQIVSGGAGHWALLSYFTRFNYGFDERYLLTGTLRADGSSRFGTENRYGYFPSVSLAWRLSNEEFFKQFDNLYNLKFRAGVGSVGNQEIGLYSFASNIRSADVVLGNSLGTGFVPDNLSNPGVKWESSYQINLGIDAGFFDNRVEIVMDVYNKRSYDMLIQKPLPATAGSLNAPFENVGEMENRGLELAITTQNSVGKIDWRTTANVSFNRNKVIDLGSTGSLSGTLQRLPVTRTEEGLPLGQYYGHQVEGIFRDAGEVAESPFQETGTRAGDLKFVDINQDGIINDLDRTYIGSPHPDVTYNIINDVNIGNFDFSIFFRGVYGNEVYNMLQRDLAGTGSWLNQSVTVIDRWRVANPDGSEPRANGNDPNANRRVSDRFVEDGSFLRLQNLSIGYSLPKSFIKKKGITSARFYASGQNLLTFTKYTGFDPEIGSFNQNPLITGIDNGRFPVARSFTIGANISF